MFRTVLMFVLLLGVCLFSAPAWSTEEIVPDGIGGVPPGWQASTADAWQEPAQEAVAAAPSLAARGGTAVRNARRQPAGSLTNFIVYMSGGHGLTAGTVSWATQRPLLNGMVEDYGNLDQLNLFAHYCFNAGATVVPFRPLGYQTNEVVIDNDDPGVVFSGSWNDSSATIFYGSPGDTPYRYAYVSTNGTATAAATYTPDIPEAGYYPVYCWTRRGTDRVNQRYIIQHSGGQSELRINHERVGSGWIWLGTYHFEQGTNGWVQIANDDMDRNPANDVVIADAIRFGNGMGDIDRGFGVSGNPREEEASRYWVQNATGQGMASTLYDLVGYSDQSDNVGAPARMADYMDDESNGGFWDRIYLGFHSNAGTGAGRGPTGLYNTNNSAQHQVYQRSFADALNSELENDLEAADSGVAFQDDWIDNSSDLYGAVFGEISESSNPNMNSTIIEVGFHDNADDANILKDPAARLVIARACFQALVKHVSSNNAAVGSTLLPDPPTHVRSEGTGSVVTLSWSAPVVDGVGGDAAASYVVYQSANGRGFGYLASVTGATSLVVTGLLQDTEYYFQVAAVNDGGESLPSETIGYSSWSDRAAPVVIVNGYTRFQRSLSPTKYVGHNLGGNVTLVRPALINRFDYVIEHGRAVQAAGYGFDSCAAQAVEDGQVHLTNYQAVLWMGGRESTFDETFSSTEQAAVSSYLSASGCFFVTGAEIGWDLDNLGGTADRNFHTNDLRAAYVSDDAGTYTAVGDSGSILAGVGSFTFDDGNGDTYDVAYPDTFAVSGGSVSSMRYGSTPGAGSIAGVQYDGDYRLIYLGFPFETITDYSARTNIMKRVLTFFDIQAEAAFISNAVVITEIMQNPDAASDTLGEWFEVYNPGTNDIDLEGWQIRDDGTDSHTITGGPLLLSAGGYLVFARNGDSATNGGVTVDYQYSGITLGNADDEIVLLNGTVEMARVAYDGGPNWPDPTGASMYLVDTGLDMNNGANWLTSSNVWAGSAGDAGSPGAAPPLPPYEPASGKTASNGTVFIFFDTNGLPSWVYWTDDVNAWPGSQASPVGGPQWEDTNPPALYHRFFRFAE